MVSLQVPVPVGQVVQLSGSSVSITGKCSIQNLGAAVVYILASPSGAPANVTAVTSAGYQVTANNPLEIEDPAGAPQPDLQSYYAAVTGLVAGDLRIIS